MVGAQRGHRRVVLSGSRVVLTIADVSHAREFETVAQALSKFKETKGQILKCSY